MSVQPAAARSLISDFGYADAGSVGEGAAGRREREESSSPVSESGRGDQASAAASGERRQQSKEGIGLTHVLSRAISLLRDGATVQAWAEDA